MIFSVARSSGMLGHSKLGRPPAMVAMSARVRVGKCSHCTSRLTPMIATSAPGTALVRRGSR